MDPLTVQYRRRLDRLASKCISEIAILWPRWTPANHSSWVAFASAATVRIEGYSEEAAQLGSEYYRAMRIKAVGFPLPVDPSSPEPSPRPAIKASVEAVGYGGTLIGLRLGRDVGEAKDVAFRRLSRAAQRHIANGWRASVMRGTENDPGATGWVRRTAGTCDFCSGLAASGSQTGETFQSHDGCRCVAEPEFSKKAAGEPPRPVSDLDSKGTFIEGKDFEELTGLRYVGDAVEKEITARAAGIKWGAVAEKELAFSALKGSIQPGLRKTRLRSFIKEFLNDEPILVIKHRGQLVVYDGNHRLAAARWLRMKTIRAKVA